MIAAAAWLFYSPWKMKAGAAEEKHKLEMLFPGDHEKQKNMALFDIRYDDIVRMASARPDFHALEGDEVLDYLRAVVNEEKDTRWKQFMHELGQS